MQFQVPQFINIEDKVIGPLTIKQFLYLLIAGVIIFIISKILNLFATIILAIPIISIAVALSFIKIGGQPFVVIIKNFLSFLKKPDFYVWKKPLGKNDSPEQIGSVEIIKRVSSKTKIKPEAKDNLQDIEWKIEVDKEE
jgi:hypothetical protein